MQLPTLDHLCDFSKIVGSGCVAFDNSGNGLAHSISSQRRGLKHVADHLISVPATRGDPCHIKLRCRLFAFFADFAQIVERCFRVDAAVLNELLAQLAALLFAVLDAWVEQREELKQERQAFTRAARKIHRQPDIKESFANRVEARAFVLWVFAGAKIMRIGEAFEERRSLLLAHAHLRGYGGWRLFLVAHACQTFEQGSLARSQIVKSTLIKGRDAI